MYDAIIIGGGPAGLSAALALGRCRRKVLICDSGRPRNAASKALHGFLTRDCTNPLEFLRLGREELKRYPNVELRHCRVLDADRKNEHFTIHTENGDTHAGRMLLLATGLVDELPSIAGLDQYYGRSVHHCPYCDGWEHQDERLAVSGPAHDAAELAVTLTNWSADVVLCIAENEALSEKDQDQLRRCRVQVKRSAVTKLEGEDDKLRAVVCADGTRLECSALFISTSQRQHCDIGLNLGCKVTESGQLDCNSSQVTSIPGLFAIGNVTRGLQLVIMAAAEGTKAAFAINEALQCADLARCEPAETLT